VPFAGSAVPAVSVDTAEGSLVCAETKRVCAEGELSAPCASVWRGWAQMQARAPDLHALDMHGLSTTAHATAPVSAGLCTHGSGGTTRRGRPAQDAVRAEFPEVSKLLMDSGGKVYQEGNVRPRAALAPLCLFPNPHWLLFDQERKDRE